MAFRAAWLALSIVGCFGMAAACGSADGKRTERDSAGAGGQGEAGQGSEPISGGTDSTPSAGAPTDAGASPVSAGAGGTGNEATGGRPGAEAGAGGQPADNPDFDGDGFTNDNDPDPLDADNPGDFSTVDAILADPLVSAALADLGDLNIDLAVSTDTSPPATLTGFYRKEDGQGTFTATSDGTDLGRPVVGIEHYDVLLPDGLFDSLVAGFTQGTLALTSEGRGNFVRGSGQHFTTFSRDTSLCSAGGSSYRTYSIRIVTGDQEEQTGDVVNLQVLAITVAVEGTLTATCELLLAGESELVGGWSLWTVDRDPKITPEELIHLCVVDEDGSVHVPSPESFMTPSGLQCFCENMNLECN
jgi:hypothetical protein